MYLYSFIFVSWSSYDRQRIILSFSIIIHVVEVIALDCQNYQVHVVRHSVCEGTVISMRWKPWVRLLLAGTVVRAAAG